MYERIYMHTILIKLAIFLKYLNIVDIFKNILFVYIVVTACFNIVIFNICFIVLSFDTQLI